MRLARGSISLVAIYAIALHAILSGVVPMVAGPSNDPLAVICHSEAATDHQSPANPSSAPSHACDHCSLCAAGAAAAAPDCVAGNQLIPVRLLHVIRPLSSAARGHLATAPNLARGPPAFA